MGWELKRRRRYRGEWTSLFKYRLFINCPECKIRTKNCGVPNRILSPCGPHDIKVPFEFYVYQFLKRLFKRVKMP